MKLLEKKRDELAKEYSLAKYPVQNIETRKDFTQDVNFARRMSHCQAFQDGFDSCLKELEPVLKELVNNYESLLFALQYNIIMFNGDVPGMTREQVFDQSNDIRDRARDALQKYKQLIGEK